MMLGEPVVGKENGRKEYPRAMVVKIKPTDTAGRTVVRTRWPPGARTSVFITNFETPFLVRAFIWHTNGPLSGEVVAGNIVRRSSQT